MKPRSRTFYPFDYIIMGYCTLTIALILLFGRPLNDYYDELAFYVGMGLLSYSIARVFDEHASRVQAFVRLLYPAMLFFFFYLKTQGLIFLMFDQFHDPGLAGFEHSIFGVDPSLYLDDKGLNVWITEILSLCYFSYYLMIPAFLLPVFFKKDFGVIKEALAAVCLMFFSSYLLFSLYPVEGPRWHFADVYKHTLDGHVFRQLVNQTINSFAVHGGCMPSSHTGVALVLNLFCFKYYRPWGWLMLPFTMGLAAGTIWGRFHYVSDVVVGAAIGTLAFYFVKKFHAQWLNSSTTIVETSCRERARVS